MLRNIDPVLGPELLRILRAMDHGDELTIADANFPATSCAQHLVRAEGVDATRMLTAVLSVLPIDTYVDCAIHVMAMVDEPDTILPIFDEFQQAATDANGTPVNIKRLHRFDFYARARESFAIVATGETRLYGNLLIRKGVIDPDG